MPRVTGSMPFDNAKSHLIVLAQSFHFPRSSIVAYPPHPACEGTLFLAATLSHQRDGGTLVIPEETYSQIDQALENSLAPSTRANYAHGKKLFATFCNSQSPNPFIFLLLSCCFAPSQARSPGRVANLPFKTVCLACGQHMLQWLSLGLAAITWPVWCLAWNT